MEVKIQAKFKPKLRLKSFIESGPCCLGGSASPMASSATAKVRAVWKRRARKVLKPNTRP